MVGKQQYDDEEGQAAHDPPGPLGESVLGAGALYNWHSGNPPLDRSLYAGDAGMLPSKSGLALQMYRKRSTFVAAWRLH